LKQIKNNMKKEKAELENLSVNEIYKLFDKRELSANDNWFIIYSFSKVNF
jgi:hypothetical protein